MDHPRFWFWVSKMLFWMNFMPGCWYSLSTFSHVNIWPAKWPTCLLRRCGLYTSQPLNITTLLSYYSRLFICVFVYFSILIRAGLCGVGLFIVNLLVPRLLGKESNMADGQEESLMDIWFIRLACNVLGYATIFVPGYLLIRYMRKVRYDETAGQCN